MCTAFTHSRRQGLVLELNSVRDNSSVRFARENVSGVYTVGSELTGSKGWGMGLRNLFVSVEMCSNMRIICLLTGQSSSYAELNHGIGARIIKPRSAARVATKIRGFIKHIREEDKGI